MVTIPSLRDCGKNSQNTEECVMSLLMGLNDTYASVRGQFLLMDPIPSLSKVFSLLLQDEKQRKLGKRLNVESLYLAVKTMLLPLKDLISVSQADPSVLIMGF